MTLSSLQGESQVNVFHLLVEIGLLPFYKHGFLKLHLVLSGCRVQDLEAIRCAGCSTKPWTLQMFKNISRVSDQLVLYSEFRSCTDIPCCILFLAYIVGMIIVGIIGKLCNDVAIHIILLTYHKLWVMPCVALIVIIDINISLLFFLQIHSIFVSNWSNFWMQGSKNFNFILPLWQWSSFYWV